MLIRFERPMTQNTTPSGDAIVVVIHRNKSNSDEEPGHKFVSAFALAGGGLMALVVGAKAKPGFASPHHPASPII
jgi:hypothetical protein